MTNLKFQDTRKIVTKFLKSYKQCNFFSNFIMSNDLLPNTVSCVGVSHQFPLIRKSYYFPRKSKLKVSTSQYDRRMFGERPIIIRNFFFFLINDNSLMKYWSWRKEKKILLVIPVWTAILQNLILGTSDLLMFFN